MKKTLDLNKSLLNLDGTEAFEKEDAKDPILLSKMVAHLIAGSRTPEVMGDVVSYYDLSTSLFTTGKALVSLSDLNILEGLVRNDTRLSLPAIAQIVKELDSLRKTFPEPAKIIV